MIPPPSLSVSSSQNPYAERVKNFVAIGAIFLIVWHIAEVRIIGQSFKNTEVVADKYTSIKQTFACSKSTTGMLKKVKYI